MDTDTYTNPYASIPLPINLGSGRTVTALHPTNQLSESLETDPLSGWITTPAGTVLTEAVYDAPDQRACTLRLALDVSGNIAAQIEAALASAL